MSLDLVALKDEQSATRNARPRRSLDLETESVVRVLPIRWRLFLIAALNASVAFILAAFIWNGANVLSRAWDDVRTVRESDKLLVLLESEASRLQNLIHRYINQPSQEVLTEILGLHGEVLSTLRNRGAIDPILSGSADELRTVTERFLQGFGEVRALQTTIAHTYENEVLKPAREMAGLYAIIEGAIGARDALLLPSLGKSREADHNRAYLRERSAQAGTGDGGALRHHRGRHRRARRVAVAFARKVARGVHREPRRRQCLLSVAGFGRRRRSPQEHHHRRANHPGDDRSRGEQPAARGPERAGPARRRIRRRSEDAGRAIPDADEPAENRNRRQPSCHDRGDQQALRPDDAARIAGARKLRPHACQYLSKRGPRRGDFLDVDRGHRRADRPQHHPPAQGDHGRDARSRLRKIRRAHPGNACAR